MKIKSFINYLKIIFFILLVTCHITFGIEYEILDSDNKEGYQRIIKIANKILDVLPQKIKLGRNWDFHLVKLKGKRNAYAYDSGLIIIDHRYLSESDEAIAYILGHEIAHSIFKDGYAIKKFRDQLTESEKKEFEKKIFPRNRPDREFQRFIEELRDYYSFYLIDKAGFDLGKVQVYLKNQAQKNSLNHLIHWMEGTHPTFHERARYLPDNFRKISDEVYAGGELKSEDSARALYSIGIRNIINLELVDLNEEKWSKKHNLNYIKIPLDFLDCPTKSEIDKILNFINNLKNRIYIHCSRGIDRTGMVIAAYRIKMDGWSVDEAIKEWEQQGPILFPHWKECLRNYYKRVFPYPQIIKSLEITPIKDKYYVGDIITAEFTITNKGESAILFDVLTVGGRIDDVCPDNKCPDFDWETDLKLLPGQTYTYKGNLKLEKPGNYHFFTAYATKDGRWNTTIPTASKDISNVKDIIVVSDRLGCKKSSEMDRGLGLDFTKWGWKNPLDPEYMYISSFGTFLDKNYAKIPIKLEKETKTITLKHLGVDLLGKSNQCIPADKPVYSICKGKIEYKLNTNNNIPDVFHSMMVVKCDNGPTIIYGHIKDPSEKTKIKEIGDNVEEGDQIAVIGKITNLKAWQCSHLHLGLNSNNKYFFDEVENRGWGIVPDYIEENYIKNGKILKEEDIKAKGWVDPILYFCEHQKQTLKESKIGIATALVIDQSGSMGEDKKLQKAQEAAKCYIDSVPEEEWISIAGFSSSGQSIVELLPIKTGKERLKQGIFSLSPSGNTNIGAGLETGLNQLFPANQEPREPIIILLSDGMHNTGQLWPSVEKCKEKKVKVYTVAFGRDADQVTLRKIAEQTSGSYHPAGLKNISHIYHKVNNQIKKNSNLFNCNDFLKPGQTLNYKVQVGPDIKQLTFFSNWQGSEVRMIITDPSGKKIIPEQFPNKYKKEGTYNIFEIESQPGIWQLEVQGFGFPPQGEQINISVSGKSDVYTNVLTFQPEYSKGQKVVLAVEIAEVLNNEKIPLKDVEVKADIQRPSTKIYQMIKSGRIDLMTLLQELALRRTNITLFDDGFHNDYQARDGIFGNIIDKIDTNGSYLINFSIKARDSKGKLIERNILETFQVGPIEKNELTVSDILNLFLSPGHAPKQGSHKKDLNDEIKRAFGEIFKRRK